MENKSNTTDYNYYVQALKQVYLEDTAPQHAYKNNRKKNPLTGKGVDGVRRPLRPWMTEKALGIVA